MTRIKIQGMSCRHCVQAVTNVLSDMDGITNVKVSLENNEAVFDSSEEVDMDRVKQAIQEAGYKVVE
ncbi:MAG: heavy-metal-associated domain-containing protein [Desulfonatronovibrio sp.]